MKEFFENSPLVQLVDRLAQRYHKSPSELLCHQTMMEFNLDVAIMIAAEISESKGIPKTGRDWKKFGIDRVVKTEKL